MGSSWQARGVVVAAVLLLLLPEALVAQAGHWEGVIRREGQERLFSVDLIAQPEWSGTFSIPGQDAPPLGLVNIEIALPKVQFEVQELPGDPIFKGILAEQGSSIRGLLTQGGSIDAFEMRRTGEPQQQQIAPNSALTEGFEGDWQGTVESPSRVAVVIHLHRDDGGRGQGTLDSADRRAKNLRLSSLDQKGRTIRFDVRLIGGNFRGELSEDGQEIRGIWEQSGESFRLVFHKRM